MANRLIRAAAILATGVCVSFPAWSQRAPVPVLITPAKLMTVKNTIQLPGTVIASRTAQLSSATGGLVKSVSVQFGGQVSAGDTVVELDDAEAQLQLVQAQAAVQEAQARLTEKQRLFRVGRNLTRRGVLTKDQADSRRAEVIIARAGVKRLRAVEASARQVLRRHLVKAPFSGVVSQQYVESGEWISPGTAIVELISDQDVLVEVLLPQKHYAQLSNDTAITLTFEALGSKVVSGRRVALSPVSDPTMRTFRLRVALAADNDPEIARIAPGMSAQVTLTLISSAQSVAVPRDAVVRKADGRTAVWVVARGDGDQSVGTVSEKVIRIGSTFDEQIVVLDGLSAEEHVVVSGNESLRAKQKVRITQAND